MAFRGRGRGRGGGGGFRFATQEVFELFPQLQKLDEPPDARGVKEEVALVRWSYRLQSFWNSSPYYLKDVGPEKDESIELMRGFDAGKQKTEQKVELADFMKCSVEYIPAELAENQGRSAEGKCDGVKSQGEDEKGVKGKKEDENEEEDDEKIEDEEEEISDGDYNQNEHFDDDEDDFNMDDDNDDEGTY
ncbi:hypothetical protein RHGRI_037568 [Rhododendron griersonianum]|uniref:DNA-directed RNA polymerase III subunit n=1 Tax=Rhododendron griersonianum TaxID=479676 RepID=A0AAV6HWH9_9ERIC|nr:hypothetical protein RHGRI_037568 [Rhododendron griersonianum]